VRVKHKPLLGSALQDEQRAAGQEEEAGEAGGVQRNPLEPEKAERVDEDAHRELSGDEEPDGGERPDPRRGEGDRQDDDRSHDCVEPEPRRLADASENAAEALAGDEHERADDQSGAERAERGCLEHADPTAESPADRDLDGPGHTGDEGNEDRRRARGHGGEHNRTNSAATAKERPRAQL
jgi:hypothetical protein